MRIPTASAVSPILQSAKLVSRALGQAWANVMSAMNLTVLPATKARVIAPAARTASGQTEENANPVHLNASNAHCLRVCAPPVSRGIGSLSMAALPKQRHPSRSPNDCCSHTAITISISALNIPN